MGIVAKKDFEDWVKDKDWLLVKDVPNPNGYLVIYLTPFGQFVAIGYDIKKEILDISPPMYIPPATPQPLGGMSSFRLPGSSRR